MLTEIEGLGVSVSTHVATEKFTWEDLEYFKTEEKDEREISHLLEINRVFHYFKNLLVKRKQPFEDFEDLQAFSIIQEHYRLLKIGKFSWEKEAYRVDKVLNLIKNSLARFDHPFDREVLDTSLVKLLFPLDLIDRYLSVVNRAYGKEVYDLALRLQTNLQKR